MTEFLLVAVPLLGVGLGSVEVAHWLLARQAVDLALQEAAREGAVTHGDPAAMRRRFDAALLPLFGGGTDAAELQRSADRLAARLAANARDTGASALRLDVLSPGRAAFDDFGDAALQPRYGRRAIANTYQHEGHQRDLARGWAGGRGPNSGIDRFDANVLRLRLTWLHRPMLPGLRALVKALAPADTDDYATQARARAGLVPMVRELSVAMQSDAVEWSEASWRGAWGEVRMVAPGADPVVAALPCGAACTTPLPVGSGSPGSGLGGASTPVVNNPWAPPSTPGTVAPGDPACGITLCCAAVSG